MQYYNRTSSEIQIKVTFSSLCAETLRFKYCIETVYILLFEYLYFINAPSAGGQVTHRPQVQLLWGVLQVWPDGMGPCNPAAVLLPHERIKTKQGFGETVDVPISHNHKYLLYNCLSMCLSWRHEKKNSAKIR